MTRRVVAAISRALIRFAEWREKRNDARAGLWGYVARHHRAAEIRAEVNAVMAQPRRFNPAEAGN